MATGRPKISGDSGKRDVRRVIRWTKDEDAKFKKMMSEAQFKTNRNFILHLLDGQNGRILSGEDRDRMLDELIKLKADLAHIGSNINQVTHQVNLMKFQGSDGFYRDTLKQLAADLERVTQIAGQTNCLIEKFI